MIPAIDNRAAPDEASGAAPFHRPAHPAVPPLRARDFWRAVLATLVVGPRARTPRATT